MRKLLYRSGTAVGLVLLSPAALAAARSTREEVQTILFGQVQIYVLIAFVIILAVAVYFKKLPEDKHQNSIEQNIRGGQSHTLSWTRYPSIRVCALDDGQ